MLCPVCATEMNNTNKCPFCGHVCEPGEDNRVLLNGQVIRDGHHHDWCRTTDKKNLAGKIVNGTHYHEPNPYQSAAGTSDARQTNPRQGTQAAGTFDARQTNPQQRVQMYQQLSDEEKASQAKSVKTIIKVIVIIWAAMFILPIVAAILFGILGMFFG